MYTEAAEHDYAESPLTVGGDEDLFRAYQSNVNRHLFYSELYKGVER
jgi:hypothetical protein